MKSHTDKERHSFYVTKPLRKVSYNTKMKNDKQYLRHWIFWIFNQTTWNNWVTVNDEENYSETLQDLYEIAAGGLPKEWFHKVSNTLNLTHLKNKKIENYNLLYPDLQKLLGEKIERPLNYQIYNKGYDSSREFQEELNKQIYYTFIEEFNNPEVDPKLLEKLEKEVEEFKLKYKDNRAYRGQKILDVIIEEDKIHNKLIECWKHYIIAGETCGQIKIHNGELNFIPISPQHIEHGRSSMDYDGKFISNSDWICVKYKWSISKILDELGDELPNEVLEELDSKYSPRASWFRTLFYPEYQYKRESIESEEEIDVFYMEWIVFEKYGILKYFNPMTYEEEYIEVDELYKPMEDQEVEWFWRKEAWGGWLIDNHITCKIKRLDIQMVNYNF
ncbi:MAG: hypothetical protein HC917_10545 [Richelia sp. SM2_1_7]|nr:hypothetical protein [Richelia sp. SM2_1_7]